MASFIDIVIRAKNLAGQKLAQYAREVTAWANNVKKHTKLLRDSSAAVGVGMLGIAASVAKTLGSYMDSEKAVNKLREAHRAWGDEIEQNIKRETAFADAMMKRYQVEDEAVVSVMAELRMLGMRTEALQDGAKAAIAFAGADGNLEDSARLVALAYQGNYERLARMIPALKNATSETEKAAIVNQFISTKLQVQAGQVDTLSGAWKGFKLAVGEAVENAGRKLAADGTIQKGIEQITAMIDAASEAFGRWADQGGIQFIFANTLGTLEQMRRTAWDIMNMRVAAQVPLFEDSWKDMVRNKKAKGEKLDKLELRTLRDIEPYDNEMKARAMTDKFLADLQKEPKKKAPVPKRDDSAPIAGSDPGIAIRAAAAAKAQASENAQHAAQIASIEASARAKIAAESKAHNAAIAQIEARKTIEEGAASDLANWKLDEEIKSADEAHAVRMAAISQEASAGIEAEKKRNDASVDAIRGKGKKDLSVDVDGDTPDVVAVAPVVVPVKYQTGGEASTKDSIRAMETEAKQTEDAIKRTAEAQRNLDEAKKKSSADVAAQRKIVEENERTAKLDAQDKAATEAIKRAEDLKAKMAAGLTGTKQDRRNEEKNDTKAEERRYAELIARQKRRGFTASREDKEFLDYMKGQKDAIQARADLAAVNQQRIDMANRHAVDAAELLRQLIKQNEAVMNLSVQR